MIVIIAGGKNNTLYRTVVQAIKLSGFEITKILEGGCAGTDKLARKYAKKYGIPCQTFEANWHQYGLQAGPIRNSQMIRIAEALIAVWDGKSRGTADVVRKARAKGIPVYIKELK